MRTTFVLAALLPMVSACSHFMPPADEAAGTGEAPSASGCEHDALIENAEDGDSRVAVREGRGGYVYTYADSHGSTIAPGTDGFAPTSGGVNGTGHALHIAGKLADVDDAYAGVGFGFVDPKGAYDASRYSGLSFVARIGAGSTNAVRLKVPDVNTDPDGKKCTKCYNDFGVDFQVSDGWKRYVISFVDLKQESDWGDPLPSAIDATQLYGLQWQIASRGAEFDLWLDDISFVGCP